eukprot:7930149-Alexandrium_andersonii.AAC.1
MRFEPLAIYCSLHQAGSQHTITQPLQLVAEWACGAPDRASVNFEKMQLLRAVHWTGCAYGAEPEAWHERERLIELEEREHREHPL